MIEDRLFVLSSAQIPDSFEGQEKMKEGGREERKKYSTLAF